MTPTPRTDAVIFTGQAEWAEDNAPLLNCVEADFARQLERELAEANRQIVALHPNHNALEASRDAWRKCASMQNKALEQIKSAVTEVILPALNAKGSTEFWLP